MALFSFLKRGKPTTESTAETSQIAEAAPTPDPSATVAANEVAELEDSPKVFVDDRGTPVPPPPVSDLRVGSPEMENILRMGSFFANRKHIPTDVERLAGLTPQERLAELIRTGERSDRRFDFNRNLFVNG